VQREQRQTQRVSASPTRTVIVELHYNPPPPIPRRTLTSSFVLHFFLFLPLATTTSDVTASYACLVCGKLFAGRSKTTPAYTHSLDSSHHVFMKLTDGDGRSTHELRTCCIPSNFKPPLGFLSDYSCLGTAFPITTRC
jgi:hypothetical protein